METAAVIVTYDSEEFLPACLAAAVRYCGEVVVIDNASSDGSVEVARKAGVRVIANRENLGFAGGVNQGFRETKAPLVLVLNPDAVLQGPLDPLIEACGKPGTACAAGLLTGEDGEPQRGFSVRRLPTVWSLAFEVLGLNRIWPSNPVNRRYRGLDLDLRTAQTVEQPAGALLLIRRDAWEELGGFDEQFYPVWFEDVDFAKRLADGGHLTEYRPEVGAVHRGAHSVGRIGAAHRQLYWYGNLLKFASKHFRPWDVRLLGGAVIAGCFFRTVAGLIAGPPGLHLGYGKVVQFAATYLLYGCTAGRAGGVPSDGGKVRS